MEDGGHTQLRGQAAARRGLVKFLVQGRCSLLGLEDKGPHASRGRLELQGPCSEHPLRHRRSLSLHGGAVAAVNRD